MNPQPSTLNPQPSTLNPQPSTLNPQLWGQRGADSAEAVQAETPQHRRVSFKVALSGQSLVPNYRQFCRTDQAEAPLCLSPCSIMLCVPFVFA